ncbi:DUF6777 domain-containing protein [Streptomyces sp. NBC_01022]|uniref:DUF6777 domain-containing protein n=1 Tax=Streptomyces sp. NBC_01022 TaxID=2903723 RepID=UPI002DDB5F34|nr:DUF6777 domain-containing protein [Streptomyces sp. NBC_01022]WRZ79853.1 hypothetical protein OG316_06060 [Streptomyces sp. NBC_01022]
MSDQPPSSGRPTGPPSGPLSGPSQGGSVPPPPERPSGPPAGPPSGGDHGGSSGSGGPAGPGESPQGSGRGPRTPWWRSVPKVATIAVVLVAAVVLTVVLTRPDGSNSAGGEVFLQAAGSAGRAPFTGSTARSAPGDATPTVVPSPAASASGTGNNVTQGVDGSAPGLYGGTRKVASCDVEKQISALTDQPAKNKAFASVEGIDPSGVPAYLRALTPVQLRLDTRVTNHGYENGAATSYQAVLQAGTAVLVDDRGVPRVRCACGNPLLPPVALKGTPEVKGDPWPGYRAGQVVVVEPAPQPVNVFVMFDPGTDGWFERDAGDTGDSDKKTDPPADSGTSPCPPKSDPCPSDSSSRSPGSDEPSSPPTDATDSGEPSTEPPSAPPTSEEPPPSPPPSSEAPPPTSESAPEPVTPQTGESEAPPPAPPASDDGASDAA